MKRYRVTLAAEEREQLHNLLARGKADVRKLKHAQILLKADEAASAPGWGDERIAAALEVGTATVEWVRRRFVMEGLEAALCCRAFDGQSDARGRRGPHPAPCHRLNGL